MKIMQRTGREKLTKYFEFDDKLVNSHIVIRFVAVLYEQPIRSRCITFDVLETCHVQIILRTKPGIWDFEAFTSEIQKEKHL